MLHACSTLQAAIWDYRERTSNLSPLEYSSVLISTISPVWGICTDFLCTAVHIVIDAYHGCNSATNMQANMLITYQNFSAGKLIPLE